MPSHIRSARDKKTWQINKQNESHGKSMEKQTAKVSQITL